LHGEDLVAFPIGSYVRHEVDKLLKQHQVECRIKLSTRSTGDIYQFVKHGAGISLIFPFDQFGESVMPELTFCELEEEYSMKIAIFRSHFRKSSLAAEQLLDLMTNMIGQALPSTRG
jgi:DNA-binding transcriptional LysR family regulator